MGFRKWIKLFPPSTVALCNPSKEDWLQARTTFMQGEEVVKGIEASFEVESLGGTVQLNLLQHEGLKARNLNMKAKLLTCPQNFADKHWLEKHGLTETYPEGQHRYMQPSAPLSIILGGDLGHIHPILKDYFKDQHGYLSLYQDCLSGRTIAMGNCIYPYSAK